MVARRCQCSGRGDGGGSKATAASLAAEAAALQKRDLSGSSSAVGSAGAA